MKCSSELAHKAFELPAAGAAAQQNQGATCKQLQICIICLGLVSWALRLITVASLHGSPIRPSEPAPGKGTLQPLGRNEYRVCGPAGCTVVKGYANALYLSRNVPEADAKAMERTTSPIGEVATGSPCTPEPTKAITAEEAAGASAVIRGGAECISPPTPHSPLLSSGRGAVARFRRRCHNSRGRDVNSSIRVEAAGYPQSPTTPFRRFSCEAGGAVVRYSSSSSQRLRR